MITYEDRTITITNRNDQPMQINAVVASNGLAYHHMLYDGRVSPLYSITHVATGWCISESASSLVTPEQCQRFVELIDPLIDWTKSMSELFGRFKTAQGKERWMKQMRRKIAVAVLQAMRGDIEKEIDLRLSQGA